MARKDTLALCMLWYVVAMFLAPLPYALFGQRELIPWCMIGLPSLPVLVFFMHSGPDPTVVIVGGYLVQASVTLGAIGASEQVSRRACYLVFCCLLVLDVCVAWLGPLVLLLIVCPGE